MLKKYTKYVATVFAVASLSTFMIGCGGEGDDGGETETPLEQTDDDTNNAAPAQNPDGE